jgi:cyclopropane-fatty-acyl-phospholipid synthase
VHGITISRRQLEFGLQRIRDAGLAERVALEFRDYRDLRGYDHLVSIEMYGRSASASGRRTSALCAALEAKGPCRGQAITIADERLIVTAAAPISSSSSSSRGCWPAVGIPRAGRARRPGVHSAHAFGLTMPRPAALESTLQPGLGEIQIDGFDERFKRLWNFYLSYCEAGFRSRSTDVLQVEMSHA